MSPPLSLLLLPKTFIPFLPFRSSPLTRRLRSFVSARTMTSQSNQRVFQLRQDPLTGTSEWIVIDENDQAGAQATSTDGLLATTSYLDMLNDTRRNRAYRLAIEKTITEPCHVLDIGAGTGLLSMMAARAMGGTCDSMVTACESYLPMVKLMRKVMHKNGMTKNINLINKRSDELEVGSDIASRADVLVSEILDSELLGEGLIPSLQHAHDMLLVDNPKSVPYRATTYCQLVESTFLCNMHDLQSNEARMSDGVRLAPPGLESLFGIKSQQYSMHVDAIENEIKLLSEPVKIFEFDFWKRPESNGELDVHIEAINEGSIHAIISWWVLQLDSEGTIFYSTAPRWIESNSEIGARDWCDHWKQCVWLTPGAGVSISKGEKVHLHAAHTCTNIVYNLKNTQSLTHEMTHSSFSTGDLQLTLPPERLAIYGDSIYRQSIFEATRNALQGKSHAQCLVIDDSLLLPLMALHISKGSRVISLSPGLEENAARYLEAIADSNGFSKDRFEYFREGKAKFTEAYPSKTDLLIGEPYYYGLESGLPWQNLRFWKDRTLLDSVLSKDAVVMPYKGVLRGCAMYLPDLWKSRCCLGDVEGFDHALVNTTLGGCGDLPSGKDSPCLPFFIWQCGETMKLSKEFTVMEFDFSKPITGPCSGEVQIEFIKPGVCHGIALWMDWVMDKENSIVISTGPDERYWKQGVKLLGKPVTVGVEGLSSIEIKASLDLSSNGELIITHTLC
ncbi:Protein arginine N-methyltransferase 1.6 [Hirschfeldia incana]|nr:Protein arginine N-methyltransferase 1.6 [Hirschfeldia incana]